jgi:hypothetical protein
MEGWRSYALNESYETLVEKYEKSLITHKHFLNVWEENMIREGNELFTEGVMDVLKQGFESAKELAGEMKDKFMNALNAIKDWIAQKIEQLGSVLKEIWENPQIVVEKIASLIEKLQGWCKVNKLLCAVTIGVVITMAVAALAAGGIALNDAAATDGLVDKHGLPLSSFESPNPALARQLAGGFEPSAFAGSITSGPGMPGALMSEKQYQVIQGGLEHWGTKVTVGGEFPLQQEIVQAQKILKQAFESNDATAFQNMPPVVQKMWGKIDAIATASIERHGGVTDELAETLTTITNTGKKVSDSIQIATPAGR